MNAKQAATESTAALSLGDALAATIDKLSDLIDAQPTVGPSNLDLFKANPTLGPAYRAFADLPLIEQLAFLRVLAYQTKRNEASTT
jgi:hypothetical protein